MTHVWTDRRTGLRLEQLRTEASNPGNYEETKCTMGQNREKLRKNSYPIIHFPTSSGVSKVSERSGVCERSECAEQANE